MQNWIYFGSQIILLVLFIAVAITTKINLLRNLKYMVPAILLSGVLFIYWAKRFIELNVWQLNADSVSGLQILNLPVEIWVYFIVLPLNVFMIFEIVKIKFRQFKKTNYLVSLSLVILVILAVLSFIFRKNAYSFDVFVFAALILGYVVFRNRFKKSYAAFYTTFIISLVPLFILEGVANSQHVITYYAKYLSGFLIFSVPFEIVVRFFLLSLLNIFIYEYLKERKFY